MAEAVVGSTFVLCGLRDNAARMAEVYQTMAINMEESTTYQWILSKGVAKGVQNMLLRQGGKRFGPADEATAARLRAVADEERLERMADRVFDAAGWDDLLATG